MKRNITAEQMKQSSERIASVLASVQYARTEQSYRARLYAENERKFFAVVYNCNEHVHNNNTTINMNDVLVVIDVNYSIMKALEKQSIKYDFSFAEKNRTAEESDFFRFNLTAEDSRADAIIKAMNSYTAEAHKKAEQKKAEQKAEAEKKAKEKAEAEAKKEKARAEARAKAEKQSKTAEQNKSRSKSKTAEKKKTAKAETENK